MSERNFPDSSDAFYKLMGEPSSLPHSHRSRSVFETYVGIPVCHWLHLLATVNDRKLFLLGAGSRFLISCAVVIAHSWIPYLLFGEKAESTLYRDNSFQLYDDARLRSLRVWDGVHFFYIAQHGYIKENSLAFFPGMPMVIRFCSYVVKDLFPVLYAIAPVVFYVTLLNVIVSGLTLVILRRLTVVTYVGVHAVSSYAAGKPEPREISWWTAQTGSFLDAPLRMSEPLLTLEEVEKEENWRHRKSDSSVALGLSRPTGSPLSMEGSEAYMAHIHKNDEHRRKVDLIIAGACFVWIISPTAIYASVAYTEAIYGFLTILAVYLLVSPREVLEGADVVKNPKGYRAVVALMEARLGSLYKRYPTAEKALKSLSASNGCTFRFRQRLTSRNELGALLCLFLAGTFRSNALLYTGFFWYPIFIQIFYPSLYRRRVLQWYAPQWLPPLCMHTVKSERLTMRGVHSLGRWPSLMRFPVLLLFTLTVLSPSVGMNYMGWTQFAPNQFHQEIVLFPKNVMAYYSYVQQRFWGVGWLNSYSFSNIPHVILPIPLVTAICCGLLFVTLKGLELVDHDDDAEEEADGDMLDAVSRLFFKVKRFRHQLGRWKGGNELHKMRAMYHHPKSVEESARLAPSYLLLGVSCPTNTRECLAMVPLIVLYLLRPVRKVVDRLLASSTIVILLLHTFIGLTIINVHVTSRFIMGIPSLYWLIGQLLVRHPTHVVSRLVPFVFVNYTLVGIGLFSNCFDWT